MLERRFDGGFKENHPADVRTWGRSYGEQKPREASIKAGRRERIKKTQSRVIYLEVWEDGRRGGDWLGNATNDLVF